MPGAWGGADSWSRYKRRQVRNDGRVHAKTALRQPLGPFLGSPENFSGPKSHP